MTTAAELRRRWSTPEQLRLVSDIRTWLTGQGPPPDGLDHTNGRTDLRGITLTATIGNKDNPTLPITWDSLDLTGAHLDHLRFFAATITNCIFDTASLTDLRLWGTRVTDSTFRRTDLRNSTLGTGEWKGRRNTWQHVTFDRANLRDVTFTAATLHHCSFEKTSAGLHLIDCEIDDCTFRGDLGALVIAGRGHRFPVHPSAISADFREARLREFSIEGYRTAHVLLPQQDDLVVVHDYPSAFRAAAAWLRRPDATEIERRTAGIFDYRLKAPGGEDTDYVTALNGYGDPEIVAAVAQALAQAPGVQRQTDPGAL